MGLGSRIATGLNKIMSAMQPPPPQGRSQFSSLNLNKIQYAMGMGQQSGGFSQPVWAPEISTVGGYSREGYTSRTLDTPVIPHSVQVEAMNKDEDVQLAINHLSSEITGGEHYWKSQSEEFTDVMTKFTRDIDFDWIDTILVKELLAYGNSIWKPRLGINHIRTRDDIMQIPISSFVRVWWDRQRRPYKYEFRGAQYQGYHNPEDIIPFVWNPINASAFGVGFLTALTATRPFIEMTPNGLRNKDLPSLLDRKYSTAMTMHLAERRYIPHNVYQAVDADDDERATLANDLVDLEVGQDIVVGNKLEVKELGSSQRAFDPTLFTDLVQGGIFKALNDFMGKQASESSHQYANAKESGMLVQIGLASFPLAVTRQLIEKLFQPWYEGQGGIYDVNYGGGMVTVPWEIFEPELNFGKVEKKSLDTEKMTKLIEIAISSGAVNDPIEIRELLEDAGLGLRKEYTEAMNQQYNNYGAMPQEMNQAQPMTVPPADRWQATMGNPPMNDPNWTSSNKDFEPRVQSSDATLGDAFNTFDSQPSDPRINFTIIDKTLPSKLRKYPKHGSGSLKDKRVRGFKKLKISDINAFLADTDQQG